VVLWSGSHGSSDGDGWGFDGVAFRRDGDDRRGLSVLPRAEQPARGVGTIAIGPCRPRHSLASPVWCSASYAVGAGCLENPNGFKCDREQDCEWHPYARHHRRSLDGIVGDRRPACIRGRTTPGRDCGYVQVAVRVTGVLTSSGGSTAFWRPSYTSTVVAYDVRQCDTYSLTRLTVTVCVTPPALTASSP